MKKLLIIALCAVIPMVGFAQKKAKKGKNVEEVTAPVVEVLSDEECMEKISLFQSYVKAGDWAGAYEFWLPVYQSRPEFRSQIYTNGAKILEYRYSQAQTDAERHALRDSIMKLHDDRIKYFDEARYPDEYVLGVKAMDYLTYFTEDELALFSALGIERQMLQMFVSSSELYNLYHHARAFVFPSAYEGFGIPILEAFACHCPVLLNRASCFPEIAGDAASYFDIRSEKGDCCLAKALQGILYDDGERDKKIFQGAKRLQDFSWEKSAMQLASIYRSLL